MVYKVLSKDRTRILGDWEKEKDEWNFIVDGSWTVSEEEMRVALESLLEIKMSIEERDSKISKNLSKMGASPSYHVISSDNNNIGEWEKFADGRWRFVPSKVGATEEELMIALNRVTQIKEKEKKS